MNKETLEEAAKKYRKTTPNQMFGDELGFIAGAKWQMERSYTEKEVRDMLQSYAEWSIDGDCTYYEWFEQFKKK